ncbi:MAG: cell division protein ZapA [Gammaproteobacteria bacterium]|nr:cell division protein ZapA [Gammaproteobacteria bacterium]
MTTNNQEQVQILDKNFNISCPPEERQSLLNSAKLLDEKMREIRQQSKINNLERIAIMAGLNLAHELLLERQSGLSEEVINRLQQISNKINLALNQQSQ